MESANFGTRRSLLAVVTSLVSGTLVQTSAAHAASARQIDADASQALRTLYATQPKAKDLGQRAKAILIFPKIYKGGFIIGGQSGDGALRTGGKTVAYYNISAASFGLQAGGQRFSYVLFFMTDSALDYLQKSDGWAIGSGPSVVVMDKGAAASMTSTSLTQDVYAFPFGQKGLMAGLGLEGSKITRIRPSA
jgi:lipid-binding SYLF domain-containing protein